LDSSILFVDFSTFNRVSGKYNHSQIMLHLPSFTPFRFFLKHPIPLSGKSISKCN